MKILLLSTMFRISISRKKITIFQRWKYFYCQQCLEIQFHVKNDKFSASKIVQLVMMFKSSISRKKSSHQNSISLKNNKCSTLLKMFKSICPIFLYVLVAYGVCTTLGNGDHTFLLTLFNILKVTFILHRCCQLVKVLIR